MIQWKSPRRKQKGFTLIEVVCALILLGIALLPLVGALPHLAIQQVLNERKDRGISTASAAMDQVTAFYTVPGNGERTLTGSMELPSGWFTFCDPQTNTSCLPTNCDPMADPGCVPPKYIWKYWKEDFQGSVYLKRLTIDTCIDLDDNDSCDESLEFLIRTSKLVAVRCPDAFGEGCPP